MNDALMRSLSVLFAALLLVSSATGAVGLPGFDEFSAPEDDVSSTPAVAQNRTATNVLTLASGTSNRTNFTTPTPNASAALSIRGTRLDRQLNTERTEVKLATLGSDSKRQAYIRRALTEVEIRTSELRAEEQEAFRLHSAGRLSTRALVIRLARIDTAAERLSENATRLGRAATEVEGLHVQTRVGALRLELRTLQGPVREHVGAVLRGDASPTRLFTTTTSDGIVLTTIIGGTYVREVYDGSRRTVTSNQKITIEEVRSLMNDRYPLLMSRGQFSSSSFRDSNTFVTNVPYRRGHLTAFVDKNEPGRVFKEEQRLRLNRTPTTEPANRSRVGLRISVYPSYPGGPMLVTVRSTRTNAPIRADVSLISPPQSNTDPVYVGSTNRTGALWTLTPRENFTVQAIKVGTQSVVDVRVRPLEPERVYDDTNATASSNSLAARTVRG